MIQSKETAVEYSWGEGCKGWHLVKTSSLGVIQETMPPGSEEVLHRHLKAQQFFFILQGQATFILEGKEQKVNAGQGIHIQSEEGHKIINKTTSELEFLVISEPHAHGDREEID